jgi:uroporphyrinogen-III synthase
MAEELERLGAEVGIVPLVEIEAVVLPDGLDPGGYDWIVLTSANGVTACRDLLHGSGADVRLAVVGPATAAAARAIGLEPAFVPARYAADAIAAGLEPVAGTRVLLAQADLAGPVLAAELRARGASVDAVVAYRTVQRTPGAKGRAALENADVVVLASGSAARALVAVTRPGENTLLACIGPKTASVAAEVGLEVGLVADEATGQGIIRALVTHLGEST